MKAVILAAGEGSRLRPAAGDRPKPLVPLLGEPIISYPIRVLVANGITDLAVVVGHRGDAIVHALGDGGRYGAHLTYVDNPWWTLGNASSVYAARQFCAGAPFLVCMGDHIIGPELPAALLAMLARRNTDGHALAAEPSWSVLAIDSAAAAPPQLDDATRVWVDAAGYVRALGKHLRRWNAIDTGVFLFQPTVFDVLAPALRQARQDEAAGRPVHGGLSELLSSWVGGGRHLRGCDVAGAFWLDADTPADLAYAAAALLARSRSLGPWGLHVSIPVVASEQDV